MSLFLPNWIKDYFQVKLGLFFLAIMLWFLVVLGKTYEHTFEIPVEPVYIKPHKMITNDFPRFALVKFQGSGKEMLRMRFVNTPTLKVNLSTINFRFAFPLTSDMVDLSNRTEISTIDIISPDSILFLLDDRISIKLPVKEQLEVDLQAGFTQYGEVKLVPDSVTFVGPKSRASRIKTIFSEKVMLSEVKRNINVALKLIQPEIFGSTIDPDRIHALVKIERIGEKIVKNLVLNIRNSPRDRIVLVEPGSIDVKLNGAVSQLKDIDKDKIEVWVDYRDYNHRRPALIPVRIETDLSIEVIELLPEEARLIVRRK